MAAATGMSQSAVSRIWRAFALKPPQVETFKLSPDPQFIDKVRDIVGLYLNPPEAAVVLCVDEKAQIQALDRSAPVLPLMPGAPARQSHDYLRHSTTNLYAALNVASGQVIAEMTPRHRAEEFRRFLNLIDASVPAYLDVHVVLDNSSTHKTPSIQRWLLRHPRFTLHFTPTYSSWLNLVERWFAELTTKWIKRSAHRSVRDLVSSIRTWIANWNDDPKPFVWHKTQSQKPSRAELPCRYGAPRRRDVRRRLSAVRLALGVVGGSALESRLCRFSNGSSSSWPCLPERVAAQHLRPRYEITLLRDTQQRRRIRISMRATREIQDRSNISAYWRRQNFAKRPGRPLLRGRSPMSSHPLTYRAKSLKS